MTREETEARTPKQPAGRPRKPYAEFPLTPHASGAWQKKIRGKIHYFGKWARRENGKPIRVEGDGWKEALEAYKAVADDLHAGRAPRAERDRLQVKDLCNAFLTVKKRKVEAGELTIRHFADYRRTTDLLVKQFGSTRLVEDLAADDFGALRSTMATRWGPVTIGNGVTRVKAVFRYGYDAGLVDKPVRYGPEFVKPDKAVMRKHRAKSAPKMFSAAELRALVDGATVERGALVKVKPGVALRAMILLGVNCGFGNTDCAALKSEVIDLAGGWNDFPRPKTGISRRCPR